MVNKFISYLCVNHWQMSILVSHNGFNIVGSASMAVFCGRRRQKSSETPQILCLARLAITLIVDAEDAVKGAVARVVQRHQAKLETNKYRYVDRIV